MASHETYISSGTKLPKTMEILQRKTLAPAKFFGT